MKVINRRRKNRRVLYLETVARRDLADFLAPAPEKGGGLPFAPRTVVLKTSAGRLVITPASAWPGRWILTHYGSIRPGRPTGHRTAHTLDDLCRTVVRRAGHRLNLTERS